MKKKEKDLKTQMKNEIKQMLQTIMRREEATEEEERERKEEQSKDYGVIT